MIPIASAAWASLKAGGEWLAALPQIIIVLIVTLPLTFLLGQCDGKRSEAARQDAARAAANVEVVRKDGDAKTVAATERATDTALIDAKHKDLIDAIQQAPDSAPDASRVAYGCQLLRQSGRSEASLPAACGSKTGGQASAH
jgi:hypothetical protein